MTRRVLATFALFALGLALAFFAKGAQAGGGPSCSTDSAAEVASATVKDLGSAWSQPGQGDLWDVNMPGISFDVSVYADDEASARAAARGSLDQQIAALGCAPATAAETTAAATTTAVPTVTQTVTVATPAPPAQTVVHTETETQTVTQQVTTAAAPAPPPVVNVSVTVNGDKATSLDASRAVCRVRGRAVPCSAFADGRRHEVWIVGVWNGNTITARKVEGH